MTPESFVVLLIFAWLTLAGVTLWALLRVSRRRARLHRKVQMKTQGAHSKPVPQRN